MVKPDFILMKVRRPKEGNRTAKVYYSRGFGAKQPTSSLAAGIPQNVYLRMNVIEKLPLIHLGAF